MIVEDDGEEDEETLQLRLQIMEAKLKLKLKQSQDKAKTATSVRGSKDRGSTLQSPQRSLSALSSQIKGKQIEKVGGTITRSKSQADIQVPVSPPRKRIVTEEPRSPGRVLLGIDKGLKGRDVSLRRPPVARDDFSSYQDPFGGHLQQRPLRSTSQGSTMTMNKAGRDSQPRSKTFSERMAEIRANDKDEKKRAEEMLKKRSKGFEVNEKELDEQKKEAQREANSRVWTALSSVQNPKRDYSREEVLKSFSKRGSGLLHRSATTTGVRNSQQIDRMSKTESRTTEETAQAPTTEEKSHHRSTVTSAKPSLVTPHDSQIEAQESDARFFDSYSAFHLSKRMLPEQFLTKTLAGKQIFQIPDLLKTIKAPDYHLPDTDGDYVVLGIIASKSEPRAHKDKHKTKGSKDADPDNGKSKYMVITLTDLKWELNLFLFTTAFERYWKLTLGTVIAILNPDLMPPRPADVDTGRFSLVLNSSDETILEIGTARDLGFCKSVKKDGKVCDSWVDKRHTEFCTFHIDIQIAKTKAGRMEVNTVSAPFAPGGRSGSRTGFFGTGRSRRGGGGGGQKGAFKDDGLRKEGAQYDRSSSTRYFVVPSSLGLDRTAADLLDDEDVNPDAFHRGTSKAERLRRQLAQREKERDIARKLGETGNGIGQEYLRLANSGPSGPSDGLGASGGGDGLSSAPTDAGSLGLLGNKAESVSLSPMKRKRSMGGVGVGDDSVKMAKKTRFVTARGIREAGRESIGIVAGGIAEDGDDGLDIV